MHFILSSSKYVIKMRYCQRIYWPISSGEFLGEKRASTWGSLLRFEPYYGSSGSGSLEQDGPLSLVVMKKEEQTGLMHDHRLGSRANCCVLHRRAGSLGGELVERRGEWSSRGFAVRTHDSDTAVSHWERGHCVPERRSDSEGSAR